MIDKKNIKVVILAGGIGSRLAEETNLRPKPLVELGGRPIIWHIMKIYSHYGFNEFVICLGFKGYLIKEFFANYALHTSDITLHLDENRVEVHRAQSEAWKITLIDTGEDTLTGGRIKRARPYIGDNDVFALTYGDGVADIDLERELAFHREHGRLATVAAVRPARRFGSLTLDGDNVRRFEEKPDNEGGWVSGGFFFLSPDVIDLIDGDDTAFEKEPLENLAARNELRAYRHEGFWHPMDTLRDKNFLEAEWQSKRPRWVKW